MRKTAILFIVSLLAVPSYSATINVNWDGSADYTTIQAGINAAVSGETIVVADGVYTGVGNTDIQLKKDNITVRSESGPELCIIDCENVTRGFYIDANSFVEGFTITNGYTSNYGGGIYSRNGHPVISNCIIKDCYSYYYGGGVHFGAYWSYGHNPVLNNCLITNNYARYDGGGVASLYLYYYSSLPIITNCTIVNNTANYDGGGVFNCKGPITNSIIWGNNISQLYSSSIPTYSCIQDWTGGGTGNITFDPLFVDVSSHDPNYWDLHLSPGSPCIDTGTNSPPGGLPATDIEGNPRPIDGDNNGSAIADMGAYEAYPGTEPVIWPSDLDFNFTADQGGANPDDQTLTIHNAGGGTINWMINETCDWLTVIPQSGSSNGEPDDVTLSVDTSGMTWGQYSCDLTISDPLAMNDPQVVTVNLDIDGSIIGLSITSFSFVAEQSGADPDDQILTITNAGGGTLNWTITESCDWLSVYPQSDSSAGEPDDVTLSVDISGLPLGQYSCDLTVSDPLAINDPQIITVDLGIGKTLFVPSQYSTIQSAIDVAVSGQIIIVAPSTYYENINFLGKNIVLTSTDPTDPNTVAATIIDGSNSGSVVTFSGTETSACKLTGFTITNGNAHLGGGINGGYHPNYATATVSNCIITGNSANSGGGLHNCDGPIKDCKIVCNFSVYSAGGLVYCDGPITNCTIIGNTTGGMGGGLTFCAGLITNCIIVDNRSNQGGGLFNCNGTITNCTITGNIAYNDCGGLYNCNGPITNCIIWDNTAYNDSDQLHSGSVPTYSCIQDWTGGGTGNISDDPLFVDTTPHDPNYWDLHLLPNSPCIDTGTNSPPGGLPPTDMDGNPRPIDGNNDGYAITNMGTYEYFLPTEPWIWPSSNYFNFSALEGGKDPNDQILTIRNIGLGTLNWTITETSDWLTVNPLTGSSTGEPDDVTLSVDISGLSAGQYSCDLTISDPLAMNDPQIVTVHLDMQGPIIGLSSDSFNFVAKGGGADPNDQIMTICNTGNGILNWTITENCDWLNLSPVSGSSTNPDDVTEVTLSVDIIGLALGRYSCQLIVSDPLAINDPRIITVDLAVTIDLLVPTQYPTIQSALDAAVSNNNIVVARGTYWENLIWSKSNVALISQDGPEVTIINGSNQYKSTIDVLNYTNGIEINGFTITGGIGSDYIRYSGGGILIRNDCSGIIKDCVITDNGTLLHPEDSRGYGTYGAVFIGINSNVIIDSCRICGNIADEHAGVYFYGSSSLGELKNCLIYQNTCSWGGAVDCHSSPIKIMNNTISNNTGNGLGFFTPWPEVTNNIITSNSRYAVYSNGTDSTSLFVNNNLWNNNSGDYIFVVSGSGVIEIVGDNGNISSDPLFADTSPSDPNNWDLHLKSEFGRWDPVLLSWVTDVVTSPCIDAGDPSLPVGDELWPHGGRINMGAYGGTPEASMSLNTAIGNPADFNNDGVVDLGDYSYLIQNWQQVQILLPEDIDRNNHVDFIDVILFAGNWLAETD